MLDQIKIASPCAANWDQMEGTDRVRFFSECQKNVFNLSSMTRRDADALLQQTNGNLCVQLYRRSDGTVLTEDCPVGLRASVVRVGRRFSWGVAAAIGFAAMALGQSPAVLSGRVSDQTGAPIPQTEVVVTDLKTTKNIKTTTGADGRFEISVLESGAYEVKATRAGFRQYANSDVKLPASGEISLKIELAVGSTGGPIYITPEPAPFTDRSLEPNEPNITPNNPKPWFRRIFAR